MTGRSHAIASAAAAAAARTHTQSSLYGWSLIVHLSSNCKIPILIWSSATEFASSRSTLNRNKACTPYALVKRSKLLIY
jgi:hypothetical protein